MAACHDGTYLVEMVFLYDLCFYIIYLCLAGHQKNPVDQWRFLKSPDGIIDDRVSLQLQELLVDVAAHPFSLTCCQNDGCT